VIGQRVSVGDVRSQERSLAAFCAAFDPAAIPLSDAAEVYESLARMERLLAGVKVRMAPRVSESGVWRSRGHRSAADCLARLAGVSTGAAQQELATAEHLESAPATREAVRRGELSVPQAAALAEAAAADPAAETRLLNTAKKGSLRELRDECARVKAAADPDADARYARIRRERSLRTFCDRDGAWNLHARGPADAGARVLARLETVIDELFVRARTDGCRGPREAYAFDALVALADRWASSLPPGEAPRSKPRFHGLLRVDVTALTRGHVEGDELCEITGVGPVPIRVAQELLGEAMLDLVITRGTDVATAVHLGRQPTAAQKAALLWTQPTCSRLGCDQTWTHAQIDHRTPWAETHETSLAELDRLCPHDHRLKTHAGWALVPGTGKRLMVPPDHLLHPANAPPNAPPNGAGSPGGARDGDPP
jgi:hypothetical protein